MFGLDESLAGISDGTMLLLVAIVAVVLGLRHAADPDHLAAVTTLVAGGKERTGRLAARLGFIWGLGHAVTLFAFGVPIVLYGAYLPDRAQAAAETGVGFMIVLLAVWLLVRWRRGAFSETSHSHGEEVHTHVHARTRALAHAHARTRSPVQAFGIGLVHGMGGSAGVGVLLLATINSHAVALVALAIFAFFTAVSMALLSTGLGLTLGTPYLRRSFNRVAPALGVASLGFGVWYALGAQGIVPYVL